jgi:O-antigen/teichoic acid export membrane protein
VRLTSEAGSPGTMLAIARRIALAGLRGSQRPLIAITDQASTSLANVVLTLFVARHYDAAEFGIFVTLVSVKLLAHTIQNSLLVSPVTVVIGKATTKLRNTRFALVVALSGWIFLAAAIVPLAFSSPWWGIGCFYVASSSVAELIRRQQFWEDRPGSAASLSFLHLCLLIGLLAIVSKSTVPTLQDLMLVHSAMLLTTALAAARKCLADGLDRRVWAIWLHWWRLDLWPFAKWNLVSNVSGYLASQAHLLFTLTLFGSLALAPLEVARQLTTPGLLLITGLASLMQVRLSRTLHSGGKEALLRETLRLTFLQLLAIAPYALVVLFSPALIGSILLGAKFAEYANALRLVPPFVVALVAQSLWQHFGFGVFVFGRPRIAALSRVLTGVLSVPVVYLLAVHFGVAGIAWGKAVVELGTVIGAVCCFALAYRKHTASVAEGVRY